MNEYTVTEKTPDAFVERSHRFTALINALIDERSELFEEIRKLQVENAKLQDELMEQTHKEK